MDVCEKTSKLAIMSAVNAPQDKIAFSLDRASFPLEKERKTDRGFRDERETSTSLSPRISSLRT